MTLRQRYEGLQSVLQACGKDGCLFLSVLSIAEQYLDKPIDLIDAIRQCRSKGLISDDFFTDTVGVLELLTKKQWTKREVENLPPILAEDEYTVAKWFNQRTGFTHFRRRGWDSLTNSVTVKEGAVQSYYIYTALD